MIDYCVVSARRDGTYFITLRDINGNKIFHGYYFAFKDKYINLCP